MLRTAITSATRLVSMGTLVYVEDRGSFHETTCTSTSEFVAVLQTNTKQRQRLGHKVYAVTNV